MKTISFRTADEMIAEEIIEKAFGMIKNGKYSEAFELRDVVPCKVKDKDGSYLFIISVADCVPVAFNITANTSAEDESAYELAVESGLFSEPLKVPKTVEIKLEWKEDNVNSYKIVKQNRDEIRGMVEQGIGTAEIAEMFGITWTEEDSEWIMKADKN